MWRHNLHEEMLAICQLVAQFPFVAMDTEFPGALAVVTSNHFLNWSLRCCHLSNQQLWKWGLRLSVGKTRIKILNQHKNLHLNVWAEVNDLFRRWKGTWTCWSWFSLGSHFLTPADTYLTGSVPGRWSQSWWTDLGYFGGLQFLRSYLPEGVCTWQVMAIVKSLMIGIWGVRDWNHRERGWETRILAQVTSSSLSFNAHILQSSSLYLLQVVAGAKYAIT